MAGFEITRGKQMKALKVLIYGVEGVGKTTLAASFHAVDQDFQCLHLLSSRDFKTSHVIPPY